MDLIEPIVKIVLVMLVILTTVMYLVLAERRVSAFIQNRIGPNRVGPFGLIQPVVDVVKLFFKEDIVPTAANKFVHTLAPIISIGVAMSAFAVIPFGNTITLYGKEIKLLIADVNVGILYILALSSLGVYGLTLSGWSSNNKYSLLGGLRASAQMISYELSMGLSIIGILLIAESLQLDKIVLKQGKYVFGFLPAWNIFLQPLGFITFLVASFAETNRLPFDLPEAEPELVGGYHTEYSGMKFGLFFLAEYANMITASAVITTLYLGGWQIPYIEHFNITGLTLSLLQIAAFCFKIALMLLFFIIVRWTVPRFRYDQLMNIGWKVMFPLALVNIALTGLVLLVYRYLVASGILN
jgi:NADH-quinone oxidoreductase subunit H